MYIVTEDEGATVGIREGWNVKKMPPGGQRTIGRHVVILLCAACTGCIREELKTKGLAINFASALPARGASAKADKLRHTIL